MAGPLKKAGFHITEIYQGLSLSRSVYYASRRPKPINIDDIKLRAAMKTIHHQMNATYGTRRMQIELNEMGYKIGRFRVRRMMKQLNLVAKCPKQHRYPTGGKPSAVASNSLNRQFNPEQPNAHWAGDITYIRTGQGWLYLAVVVELFSRKIISWAIDDKISRP